MSSMILGQDGGVIAGCFELKAPRATRGTQP
jgi:hypothetical protein